LLCQYEHRIKYIKKPVSATEPFHHKTKIRAFEIRKQKIFRVSIQELQINFKLFYATFRLPAGEERFITGNPGLFLPA